MALADHNICFDAPGMFREMVDIGADAPQLFGRTKQHVEDAVLRTGVGVTSAQIDVHIRDKGHHYVPRRGAVRQEVPEPMLQITVLIADAPRAVVDQLARCKLNFNIMQRGASPVAVPVEISAGSMKVVPPIFCLEALWFSGGFVKTTHAGFLPETFRSKAAAASFFNTVVRQRAGFKGNRNISKDFNWASDWYPPKSAAAFLKLRVRAAARWAPAKAWVAASPGYSVAAVTTLLLVGARSSLGVLPCGSLPLELWYEFLYMLDTHQLGQPRQAQTHAGMHAGSIFPGALRLGDTQDSDWPVQEGKDMLINTVARSAF